jgi:hypothetical protein
MARQAQVIAIEEMPGNEYPDLQAAQRAALPFIADSLTDIIREMLESGELVLKDNKIIPAEMDKP